MSIWTNLRIILRKWNDRLNFIEKFIIFALLVAFLFPLTLPNSYHFGYIEIRPPKLLCPHKQFNLYRNANGYFNNSEQLATVDYGGRYHNKHCDSNRKQRVAIIVPFRNRTEHLTIFLQHMHSFLIKQNQIDYQIFIIEQADDKPFNRANLLNIGFQESLGLEHEIDCFIFHDVDILPLNIEQTYSCTKLPKHLCSYLDKFRFVLIYPTLFGGVITISKEQFRHVNGYSNLYSGWGGEDDDFYQRIKHNFGLIERYPQNVARCTMIKHGHEGQSNVERQKLLANVLDRISTDGLSTLNTTYVRKSIEFYPLYTKIQAILNE
ncbi:beta-1,4-galactosyltransferase 1 [Dermatophagoides farinae]|uniref:Beta-1,4-N-acetylgalactosaminyltransferase n=1 Tax=Dermatophagoides farinae TaxID=6954 RepID=A0A9D4SD54_DERFA|nr:beta-1,4-galactosyltransferase 1-like [Dermatophagoides farinae]KAH7637854.1 beta-1 [Dermatophagoides farinae]